MYVFSISDNDLKNLTPERAVDFFRRLLWAEAARTGVSLNLIDVPQCINVGDGGLDAFIENATPIFDDLIPQGSTGYQIKASDLQPSQCRKEVHQNNNLDNPLKPEVKKLLDNNGTYVLVLFGDLTVQNKKKRLSAIQDELQKYGYNEPKVRIYTISQLVGFTERFPSLVALLKNERNQCLAYSAWSLNRDVSIPEVFVQDECRQKIMKEIQDKIRYPEGKCQVLRITGLSGLGKTRLVFEALASDDLKNRVIYVKADRFKNSELCHALQSDSSLSAIIVIDDCDLEQHEEFVRFFSNRGARLALITLSYDPGNVAAPTLTYRLKPLSKENIKEILKNECPGLPQSVADRIAEFADGYPRIATLLAENFLANPGVSAGDLLAVSDDALFNRLIAGRKDVSSEQFKKEKRVLMGLALFEKVGYNGHLSVEAKWISEWMNINWLDFQEIVREQKQRGIIQGEHYLYVTPFLLAVHLVREWWETYGNELNFEQFIDGMPDEFRHDLMLRFFVRIPYISTTEPGRQLVKKLLSERGLFADGSLLKTKLGAEFFLKLTEADPETALICLKRTIGTWNKDELLNFTTGRREVVWALEKIAVWKNLFADAARLLLALGEAENEAYANNASGVFAGLFSPGPGQVAPTEASPEERFPILVEALSCGSMERKKLALRAFDCALHSGHFSRMVGAEYQGGRKPPELWQPKTYGELFDAYRRVWQCLEENLEKLPEEIRKDAVRILLNNARGLVSIRNLSEMVMNTLKNLAANSCIDKEEILSVVISILHYDGKEMPPEERQEWITFRDNLTGASYSELLRRFVGMDLLEDYFDEDGNITDQAELKIRELALQAAQDPGLLVPEFSWLMTERAKKGHAFGYELGKADAGFSLLPTILSKQAKAGEKGSAFFLGGYFKAVFEKNPQLWEEILDTAASDDNLRGLIPELTWRSGITDRAAVRLLELAQKGYIEINDFGMFRFGGEIRKLSEAVFFQWANFLLQEPTGQGAQILLDLFYFYYCYQKEGGKIPKELALNLLLHYFFFENPCKVKRNQMVEYCWTKIALALFAQYPETGMILGEKLLTYFGNEGGIISSDYSEAIQVLNEIAQRYPKQIWKKIISYIGPPIDGRAFYITHWLRGNIRRGGVVERGSLTLFDPEDIWEWVEENIEKRAWYLATFVPPVLFRAGEKTCFARELLVRYGERDDVRRNLSANFSTESWSGPASIHFEKKKNLLLDYKKEETNSNVLKWIEEYVCSLEYQIEKSKIEEEREGY
ncbi:hypothetical protein IT084_01740 [Desulfallas sp. Bu1-1]|uniref:hypothetical protein n=1 Tax=Desulfallas sp. Bu1-1 TaxID=2787620 RepID=UPI00189F7C25|nr:hypothetical protein [Desulfallas sp. Bu1-1]MBF7081704.1 hypothetical protein [Desulfallas sp. Bu1-1]